MLVRKFLLPTTLHNDWVGVEASECGLLARMHASVVFWRAVPIDRLKDTECVCLLLQRGSDLSTSVSFTTNVLVTLTIRPNRFIFN